MRLHESNISLDDSSKTNR